MPSAKLAEAIGITEDEFRAWSATWLQHFAHGQPRDATATPTFKGHRPDRVLPIVISRPLADRGVNRTG